MIDEKKIMQCFFIKNNLHGRLSTKVITKFDKIYTYKAKVLEIITLLAVPWHKSLLKPS